MIVYQLFSDGTLKIVCTECNLSANDHRLICRHGSYLLNYLGPGPFDHEVLKVEAVITRKFHQTKAGAEPIYWEEVDDT